MTRKLLCLSFIILFGYAAGICLAKYSGGDGSESNPYRISDANDMNAIGADYNDWDKHFVMTDDINLAQFTGTQFNIIGNSSTPFTGIFDGCGHTISGFSVSGVFHVGLFGYIKGATAEIRGLGLIQPEADGRGEVGSLVGYLWSGSIEDCYAVDVNISGEFYVGGLVGLSMGRISNCYASGSVSGTSYRTGGLAGYNSSSGGVIDNCYATSSVISMMGSWGTGGLAGDNDGVISNCYAIGSVQGGDEVGGLVGENGYQSSSGAKIYGRISNSYSAGEVSGASYVGGFVGHHEFGSVNDCFWDVNTSGIDNSSGGMGKTTAEMQTESIFTSAGWDFVGETVNGANDIWWIHEGKDYPRLWWETIEPVELLDILAQDIIDLDLRQGIENSLLAKLDTALQKLEDDNENNDTAAINLLEAFINAVEAQRGKKIPKANADVLIAAAQEIIELLSDG